MVIDSFSGKYRFLSNFWYAPRHLDGELAPTAEHAFQAQKTVDPVERARILAAETPGDAKKLGRRCTLRSDWERVKLSEMRRILEVKFDYGTDTAMRLIGTGDALLVEGNTWGDTFWGVSRGNGENWLGHLLMARRAELIADIRGDS
jgi:ribA/ribD-fused uncharacterized protein